VVLVQFIWFGFSSIHISSKKNVILAFGDEIHNPPDSNVGYLMAGFVVENYTL